MSKIQILPDIIANQIAAGEVVERPAAAVKELIENSIDAGAKNIIVRFSHGGKYSIIVEDDGCGMSAVDAELAFKRHATSKIATMEDINNIHTFGFRGEAIPSIASVSLFTMQTRTSGETAGTEIVFNGGKPVHTKECGMPRGTTIKVEQLFHNTPARRLFLKTDQTESNLIINLVKNFALAEREIRFDLYSDTRKIFSSPFSKEWADRVNEVFFDNEKLLSVSLERDDCKIEGVICDPNSGNFCKKFLSFFVNRRPIDSKLLRFAINDALTPILPKHREPIAFLFIDINPHFVDVNVHPTKREVRFRNEQFIKNIISEAISNALQSGRTSANDKASNAVQYSHPLIKNRFPRENSDQVPNFSPRLVQNTPTVRNKQIFQSTKELLPRYENLDPQNEATWKFIGKIFENCAIFENESGMIVLNMRLATIKILYEKLKKGTQSKTVQSLLFPIDFVLLPEESEALDDMLEMLGKEGLEVYAFGKNQYRIAGIPEWLSSVDAEKMIKDLLAANVQYDSINNESTRREFAGLASKYARYESPKSAEEIQSLLNELLVCETCTVSPNGYSTFFEIPKCDFIKRFGQV